MQSKELWPTYFKTYEKCKTLLHTLISNKRCLQHQCNWYKADNWCMVYLLMFLPNGFYKGKQTNKQFLSLCLSLLYKFHQSHTEDCNLRGVGCLWIYFFFFIKLKYSAQAICSPCFPLIIFPSPVFLQPGNPSSCPYQCSGSASLLWAAPPGPWFRGGCRARISLDIPVKQFSTCIWSRGLWSTVIFPPSFSPWAEFLWAGQAHSY